VRAPVTGARTSTGSPGLSESLRQLDFDLEAIVTGEHQHRLPRTNEIAGLDQEISDGGGERCTQDRVRELIARLGYSGQRLGARLARSVPLRQGPVQQFRRSQSPGMQFAGAFIIGFKLGDAFVLLPHSRLCDGQCGSQARILQRRETLSGHYAVPARDEALGEVTGMQERRLRPLRSTYDARKAQFPGRL
jgi:hypothetical protein